MKILLIKFVNHILQLNIKQKGTGIGLYMTEEIIENHMFGNLLIQNVDVIYEEKSYKKGTEVIIELNSDHEPVK